MTVDANHNLLIVEDDKKLAEHLSRGLTEEGYLCRIVASAADALRLMADAVPSLILLDLGLPDADGIDLLKDIRARYTDLPVVITTARSEVADRISGLEGGADDYLVKPYAFEELLARIRIQLRHAERAQLKWTVGDLIIDLTTRTASRAGELLDLTPREFDLLAFLASLRGEIASREMLQQEVWNVRSAMTTMDNVIDVHVSRLRQKLALQGHTPLLHTVRGVGLVLREEP